MLTAKGLSSKLISAITEYNIHFNHHIMDSLQVSQDKLSSLITNYLEQKSNILQVVELRKAAIAPLPQSIRERIVNGFNPQRSGDLIFITKSGVVGGGNTGTGHGVFYNYDAHIPLLFYGKGIKKEEVKKVVDLALERFIQSERLNLLGTPLAKENENLDWDAEELVFELRYTEHRLTLDPSKAYIP